VPDISKREKNKNLLVMLPTESSAHSRGKSFTDSNPSTNSHTPRTSDTYSCQNYTEGGNSYCCSQKCFPVYDEYDIVDGRACVKCGAFLYCMCDCKSFTKQPVPSIKDRRVFFRIPGGDKYTCCQSYCEILNLQELIMKDFVINCLHASVYKSPPHFPPTSLKYY